MADLLNTSDVPLAPSAKTTQTILPDWYTNYAMETLAAQKAVSANPYPTYGGPRVADLTGDQQAGLEATRGAAGAGQPALGAAQGALTAAAGITPSTMAQPLLGRAGALSVDNIPQYMSPYSGAVLDRIGALGNRNLTEKILPAIGDRFIGAGQDATSTRYAGEIGKALRDTQEGISATQAQYLDKGYGDALSASGADLSRLGALAGTAGQLGTADVNAGITTGGALSNLAQTQQQVGLTGAGSLLSAGALTQGQDQKNLDVAYQDFLKQQGYDQTQIDAMTRTLGGIQPAVPKAITEEGYGPVDVNNSKTSTAGALAQIIAASLFK